MYQLIVFDWDGTLFDSTAHITLSLQEACTSVGLEAPSTQRARYVIGLGLHDALRYVAPTLTPDRYPDLALAYRQAYASRLDDITLFEGIPGLLKELATDGLKLAVATGKTRRGLDEALRMSELASVFHATRTADETASKPDPRMLLELIDELQVQPSKVLMVGDTTHDVLMARNAGVDVLAVTYGAHDTDALNELSPRALVDDVPALKAWLRANTVA